MSLDSTDKLGLIEQVEAMYPHAECDEKNNKSPRTSVGNDNDEDILNKEEDQGAKNDEIDYLLSEDP